MSDFKAKCTKFNFGWATPQTPPGQLTALPRPLGGFKGPTSKRREGKGWEMEGKREGRGGKERRREGGKKKGGREEKGRGAYRDEAPLTKILNTPLVETSRLCLEKWCTAPVQNWS